MVWLLAGTLLLAVFVFHTNAVADAESELKGYGFRTTATALADSPTTLRCGQVPVAIRYFVDAAVHEADLYVDGCEHQISAGDSIEIYVDRTNPNRFVADRSDNAAPLPTAVAIFALILGITTICAALIGAARLLRIRRTLGRVPWVTRDATVMKLRKRGTIPGSTKPADSHLVIALESDAEPKLLKTAFTVLGHQTIAPTSTVIPLRTAHHGSSWVVARDVDSRPIAAREVRSAGLRDRALRELETPGSD